jgi:hypothetical protein
MAAVIAYCTSTGYSIAAEPNTPSGIVNQTVDPLKGHKLVEVEAEDNLLLIEYINKDCKQVEAIREGGARFTKPNGDKKVNGEGEYAVANGLTNRGFWYQAAVEENGADKTPVMVYTVFNNKGEFVTTGAINFNKEVDISHGFRFGVSIDTNGMISMYAVDLDNGATAEKRVPCGGEYFVGSNKANNYGFSTSLFREKWVDSKFRLGSLSPVKITLVSPQIETANFALVKTGYPTVNRVEAHGQKHAVLVDSCVVPVEHSSIFLKLGNTPKTYFMPSAQESLVFVKFTVSRSMFLTQGTY